MASFVVSSAGRRCQQPLTGDERGSQPAAVARGCMRSGQANENGGTLQPQGCSGARTSGRQAGTRPWGTLTSSAGGRPVLAAMVASRARSGSVTRRLAARRSTRHGTAMRSLDIRRRMGYGSASEVPRCEGLGTVLGGQEGLPILATCWRWPNTPMWRWSSPAFRALRCLWTSALLLGHQYHPRVRS